MTLAPVIASPFAGQLTSRLGEKWTAACGFAISGAGLMLVASRLPSEGALVTVLLGMVVAEAGFMLANVPLTIAATGGAGEDERGLASGLLSTSTEFGNALGWAAVATVISAGAGSGSGSANALLQGLGWGALICRHLRLVGPGARDLVYALRGRWKRLRGAGPSCLMPENSVRSRRDIAAPAVARG